MQLVPGNTVPSFKAEVARLPIHPLYLYRSGLKFRCRHRRNISDLSGSCNSTMTLSGYTGNIVKWQKSVDAVNWTDIANTTTTYSETPASAGTWQYRAVVHNAADMTSAPTSIVVNPLSVGGSVTGGITVCSGSTSGLLTLSGQTECSKMAEFGFSVHNLDRYCQYGNNLYIRSFNSKHPIQGSCSKRSMFYIKFNCHNSFC